MNKVELGDFQTPEEWALLLTELLPKLGIETPSLVIEPTCGVGSFVKAAMGCFPAARIFGFDINPEYVSLAQADIGISERVNILCKNFFDGEYAESLGGISGDVLFLGNPPWVTNSKLGTLGSKNLPEKSNHNSLRGIEAITGKSNFDISEWMICRMLDFIQVHTGSVAMICKSSVARKTLAYAASKKLKFSEAKFIPLDAKKVFNVSVDCGFFIFNSASPSVYEIEILDLDLNSVNKLGDRNGRLVSNTSSYDQWSFLDGVNLEKWRSGIKHDCSAVYELRRVEGVLRNGLNEIVDIEDDFVFPFLKSSDLANDRGLRGDRFVIVTQQRVGQETESIREIAPKTWKYLTSHQVRLQSRKSSIYKSKPPFSIFGVGPYSFSPWKVAISGFYKSLNFVKLGSQNGKPVMVDDTCYFLPCETEEKADAVMDLLFSDEARSFLSSIIFWDAKRPVSVDILQRLKLDILPNAEASLYKKELNKEIL